MAVSSKLRLAVALVAATVAVVSVAIAVAVAIACAPRAEFVVGGALVNLGFRLQDHLHAYDFDHDHDITPEQVFAELEWQNGASASVRTRFPRSTEHPLVAMLVCMDARIDTNELAGDTRRYYYVVRTAGSVVGDREQEMLELAAAVDEREARIHQFLARPLIAERVANGELLVKEMVIDTGSDHLSP